MSLSIYPHTHPSITVHLFMFALPTFTGVNIYFIMFCFCFVFVYYINKHSFFKCVYVLSYRVKVGRCSSVVRAFAHGAMGGGGGHAMAANRKE